MTPGELRRALRALTGAVRAVLAAGSMPVVLGGDHTTAIADVTALADHFGRGRIAVIPLRRPRGHR
jgi:agmatinase